MNSNTSGFAALGLAPELLDALAALGYEEPTPIQREAIKPLLEGRDVLGLAATGTGKTAAFALPLLQRIAKSKRTAVSAIVLVPTRELAMQVSEALHKYGKAFNITVLPIYGGQSMSLQLRALKRGVDVVVATPGRALDHIERGTLKIDEVQAVVLDEADEMLNMGFSEDLEAIVKQTPKERQTALFSATLSQNIARIAERYLNKPVHVKIAREPTAVGTHANVRETVYVVDRPFKVQALGRILDMEDPDSALVFCRTRNEVDELVETLNGHGYRSESLHGGLSQEQRDRVMKRFRSGEADLLIATDVAARGLDVEKLSHVFNFDVPSAPEVYVHRIGRTGRAGRSGVAITLVEVREERLLRNIERLTKRKIKIAQVPSVADLRDKRLQSMKTSLLETIQAGDLVRFRAIVESLQGEHDVLDIAAAAVKLVQKTLYKEEADIPKPKPKYDRETRQEARGGGGYHRGRPASGGGRPARGRSRR
jgi:ATP-dependent RNA helicase DeaD